MRRSSLRVSVPMFAVALSVGCGLEQGGLGPAVATARDPSQTDLDAAPTNHADGGRRVETDAGRRSVAPDAAGPPAQVALPVDAVQVVVAPKDADECRFQGLFALRIEARVRWEGTTLFDIVPVLVPGRGLVRVFALVGLGQRGVARSALFRACGAEVPDFASSVGERYGVRFPDQVWENIEQRWPTDVSNECEQPGCAFATNLLVAQLGISIADHAPWPGPRDALQARTLRDDDKDGLPGIMLRARGPNDPDGAGYRHPPADALRFARVRELQLALRLGAELAGKRETCDSYQGSGDANTVTLDTRALACRLDSGQLCSADQLGFVDDNLPVWSVDSVTWAMQRVADSAGCAEARAAVR